MKRIFFAALLVSATTWVSCTPDKKTEETEVVEAAAEAEEEMDANAATDTTLTNERKELLQKLAQHNLLQVELGKLAATKSKSAEVKQNAQQLVQLHTTSQTQLQDLANNYNLTLATTLEEDQRKHLDDLTKAKADEFDNKYLEKVTDLQKETIKEYDNSLKDVAEADATTFGIWANKSEKELRAQYEQTLALQQQLKTDL